MAAKDDTLQSLHEALANDMLDRLSNGEEVVKDGEVVRVKPSAATLNAIRQFLKDNGIEAQRLPGNPLGKLASQLPFTGEEDDLPATHPSVN